MHVLAIEKDTAVFRVCGADCTCERSKADRANAAAASP
jgi:hypothetical protein